MYDESSITYYGDRILWEIPVQLCIKDFLKVGDCALDIGTNIGALAIAMSRMVTNTGHIHAFEANPYLIPRIKRDLEANNIKNVVLNQNAVWSKSNEKLSFYCEKSFYAADSSLIFKDESSELVFVESISIDDYCKEQKITPQVIKIDVEGAEYDVLLGASWVIGNFHPVIALEYRPNMKNDCLEYLKSFNYTFYDTNLYQEVNQIFYTRNFQQIEPVNIIAIPSSIQDVYRTIKLVKQYESFIKKGVLKSDLFDLEPGRYQLIFDFSGPHHTKAGLKVSTNNNIILAYYEAPIFHLKQHSCSHIIIEIFESTKIMCELIEIDSVNAIELQKIQIIKIDK